MLGMIGLMAILGFLADLPSAGVVVLGYPWCRSKGDEPFWP
jgi:hypothetical protein